MARAKPSAGSIQKHVAFLRAINVGGHTVTMERLRTLFKAMKLSNVETFIASGNVIFETPAKNLGVLEAQLEQHLKRSLGYEVVTFIRSIADVAAIGAYRPFSHAELTADGHSLFVAFLKAAPTKEGTRKLLSSETPIDDFHVRGREVYWRIRGKFSDSQFSGARFEKTLGMSATIRNVTTVRRLASKLPAR